MTLSKEDGELYYKLWLPLLDYVNQKYGINTGIKQMTGPEKVNPSDVKEIADKLWNDVSVIDEYLAEHAAGITGEHREIIDSWKRRVKGRFILERHLKQGSVFISTDDDEVYLISGIISSWEEMFYFKPTPIMMNAVFMPFKGVIISDGLVMPYNIVMGGNMKRQFKDRYMEAKNNGTLHKTL